jgi:hypothetical protein
LLLYSSHLPLGVPNGLVIHLHTTNSFLAQSTSNQDAPLKDQYPSLYNIVNHTNVTVANVFSSTPLNIGFRRTLLGNRWDRWVHLVTRLMGVQITDQVDTFKWGLTTWDFFCVKSMYNYLINGHTIYLKKYIWKIKAPLKIRIFLWFHHKEVILTNHNLCKRGWHGSSKCCFCDQDETIQYLFFTCPFVKIIWRIIHMTFNIPLLRISQTCSEIG